MKHVSILSTLDRNEFEDLCVEIVKDFVASTDLANPMRYTTPISPIINVTDDNVTFLHKSGLSFTYNVMSHDGTPSGPVAHIVNDLDLFQSHYFEHTPSRRHDSLKILKESLLESLKRIFKYIESHDKHDDFSNVNYIFLSNIDLDLTEIDYSKWIDDNLNSHYPNVHFQIGTSLSILNNISTSTAVKEKYLNIVNDQQALLILPTETGIQAVPFDFLGLNRIKDISGIEPCNILVRSDRRIREIDNALDEFNELLNRIDAKEDDFQQFFIRHPVFLTGFSYKSIRSKVILEREDADPLIPDFFLEPVSRKFWDIVEIKKPEARFVIRKKNRERFSSNVFEAVAQVRAYGNYFDDPRHRKLIAQKYGIDCYRPKLAVVIGSKHLIEPHLLRDAELDFNRVQVFTYDDLVQHVMNIRNWLSGR